MPQFTSTNIGCDIINYFSSSSTDPNSIVNPGLNFVKDASDAGGATAVGGGYFEVFPHDDTVDGRYDFFVIV